MIFVFISCTENTKQKPEPDKPINQFEILDAAKQVARQILINIERSDKKEISKSAFEKGAQPMQVKLDSLRKLLQPWAVLELEEHRRAVLDSIVNRKAKRDRRK